MIRRLLGCWMFAIVLAPVAVPLAWAQREGNGAARSARAVAPAPVQAGATATPGPVTVPGLSASAGDTREDLRELLRRYPPDLARVLKLDPGLMANETYMATYPQLGAFLAQHPEIMRSPDYFLEGVWLPVERGPENTAVQLWQSMMDYCAGLLVFSVVTTVLVWLVKTLLEQRRWTRLSKVQTDVHSKLLDRFGSNEDILAYMQSSPGKRLLEATPIPVDAPSRGV